MERTIPTDEAIARARRFLSSRGAAVKLRTVGSSLPSVLCDLSIEQRIVTSSGKGIQAQAVASALFEGIEHAYGFALPEGDPTELALDDADGDLKLSCPDFAAVADSKGRAFARTTFFSIEGDRLPLAFPTFLLDPDYKPAPGPEADVIRAYSLTRYSTNSGTAAGCTGSDAKLHGALELIERDSLGIELIRTVMSPTPDPVRSYALDSLPIGLQRLIELAASEAGSQEDPKVWDITSELGVPTALACVVDKSGQKFFGSGASLSRVHSAERAILEAVQHLHAYRVGARPAQLKPGLLRYAPRITGCYGNPPTH